MQNRPETHELNGLSLTVHTTDRLVTVAWQGVSDARDVTGFLVPIMSEVMGQARGKALLLDFTGLKYMNSASVAPILGAIKTFDAERIQTTALYDTRIEWQRINFQCMKAIARTLSHFQVESTAPPKSTRA